MIQTWSDQPDDRLVFLIFFTFQYRLNHGGSDFLLGINNGRPPSGAVCHHKGRVERRYRDWIIDRYGYYGYFKVNFRESLFHLERYCNIIELAKNQNLSTYDLTILYANSMWDEIAWDNMS